MSLKNNLTRQIGLWSLVTYYFSTIVGVGVFIVPLTAARIAGPASIISWLMVLIVAYPFAIIFANISRKYRISGNIQKFVEEAFGCRLSNLLAVFLVLTAMLGNAILGFYSSQYIMELFNYKSDVLSLILSILVMALSCIFNLLNIKTSSKVQGFALLALVIIIEITVGLSIPKYHYEYITPFLPNGFGSIFLAIIPCVYSVVGWETINSLAEEVDDPDTTYERAVKITLFLIALFYISVVLTVIFILTPVQIKTLSTVLTILLQNLFGHTGGIIGSIIAITLLFLGTNTWILGTSRFIFSLARDKILPEKLAKVSEKTGIPVWAVTSQLIVYSIIYIVKYIAGMHEDSILEVASISYLIIYAIIFAAGIKVFKKEKKLKIFTRFSFIIALALLLININYKMFISALFIIICAILVFRDRLFISKKEIINF